MFRIARRLCFRVLVFLTVLQPLTAQQTWNGPVPLKEFVFDRMSLYAIGWSKEGELAYGAVTPADNGSFYWQWYILDLIEDKTLYESPRWTLLDDQTPAELWNIHPEWFPQLVRFGITPASTFTSGGQIFQHGADSYRMAYTLDRSESENHPGGLTKNIRIDLYRNFNTAKTVYSYTPGEGDSMVDDMILKGYILSPYENRTALVTLEKRTGTDEISRWNYRIIGAHLSLGFSAVQQSGSALAEAVLNGQYYVARMLLSEGADPDSLDSRGYPPVLIAARLKHWQIMELLLSSDADAVSAQDESGRTALHYAAESGDAEGVRLLLAKGADPDLKDLKGQTPRILAGLSGDKETIRAFR